MAFPLRVAVVSPFLDKTHGTERCVAEQVQRLAHDHGCEIVLYCQEIRDVELSNPKHVSNGRITWRKVPKIPGPQLIGFVWWFVANHVVRWLDRRKGRFAPDVLFSPGINCLDANVIGVHIVFAEFYSRVREQLTLRRNPFGSWPRLIHRRIYYRLIMALERKVYRSDRASLAGVSSKVVHDLERMYGRKKDVYVIYHGVDQRQFNPEVRTSLRPAARQGLGLPDSAFALLLVGNDWKKKGLGAILEAMATLQDPSIWLLVVGRDDPAPYQSILKSGNLGRRVLFLPMRPDVESYYAAADAYVGPSLEDAFALPPLEAVACGIPTITSRQAGVSELLTHGVDGLILDEPTDSAQLAILISQIASDQALYSNLAENAARTARSYTWEKNAELLFAIFLRKSINNAEMRA